MYHKINEEFVLSGNIKVNYSEEVSSLILDTSKTFFPNLDPITGKIDINKNSKLNPNNNYNFSVALYHSKKKIFVNAKKRDVKKFIKDLEKIAEDDFNEMPKNIQKVLKAINPDNLSRDYIIE